MAFLSEPLFNSSLKLKKNEHTLRYGNLREIPNIHPPTGWVVGAERECCDGLPKATSCDYVKAWKAYQGVCTKKTMIV